MPYLRFIDSFYRLEQLNLEGNLMGDRVIGALSEMMVNNNSIHFLNIR